jgi:hypothetical protein
MKNKKQPLSHVQEEALTLLKQDWHLLSRSTRAARTNKCSQLGISNRAIASALNVDEGTVRQDLKVHRLSDTEKLEIDRGAAVAPLLKAHTTAENRRTMLAPSSEPSKGQHRNGLLQVLRSFAEKIPAEILEKVIREALFQIGLHCGQRILPRSFPGLTPKGIIARTEPELEEDCGFEHVNFWSRWIEDWTLALVPDYDFVDDTLRIFLQDASKLRLAA